MGVVKQIVYFAFIMALTEIGTRVAGFDSFFLIIFIGFIGIVFIACIVKIVSENTDCISWLLLSILFCSVSLFLFEYFIYDYFLDSEMYEAFLEDPAIVGGAKGIFGDIARMFIAKSICFIASGYIFSYSGNVRFTAAIIISAPYQIMALLMNYQIIKNNPIFPIVLMEFAVIMTTSILVYIGMRINRMIR